MKEAKVFDCFVNITNSLISFKGLINKFTVSLKFCGKYWFECATVWVMYVYVLNSVSVFNLVVNVLFGCLWLVDSNLQGAATYPVRE